MRQIFLFFLLLLTTAKVIAQQSPLASGHCYKIGVTQSGIYKIDGNFLKKNGVDISKINPKNIHIFGNGSGMLPQASSAKRPNGLLENAIEITGEEDGKFDATDKILFYGQSPHKILYDIEKQQFSHETNIYSDSTFYFLVINDTPGLRIKSESSSTQIADTEINVFDDYIFHESELKNLIGKSGREWYGEELNSANQFTLNFDLKLNGLVPNTKGKLTTAMVGATIFDKSNFKVFVNDKPVENLSAESINDYIYGAKGAFVKKITEFDLENNTNQKIKILLEKNPENTSRGFLDYWGLQLKRPLNIIDELLIFRSVESQKFNYSEFIIGTTKAIKIWDITNPQIPDNLIFKNDIGNITFTLNTKNTLREFIAFTDKSFAVPQSFKAVENQNIRAIQSPELLIITTKKFKEAALKLADHRFKNDQITTEVVEAQEIFNEFSSGKPDVTAIRDFVKYLYSQTESKLKYLLLFADASFDIRNKDGDVTYQKLLSDYIPAYQSRESLDNVKSYSSDDYFGFMDDDEGEWPETEVDHDNHTLEIGVGRIPVKTAAEAQNIVEKLIYYDSKLQTLGSWRSKIVLASDDGDSNLHQKDSEDLGEIIKTKILNYRPEKIYVDNYPRIAGNANGKLSPEVSKKISSTFKNGALVFNYIGHGGTSNLSDEKILTRDDIGHWQNLDNMPLMVTATCEFGRYDNPGELSGAEVALLNPNGGAIALLTTTRPVYAITNKKINEAFYNAAFQPINGQMPRLGDILRPTKNNSFEQVYNRNFTLLGDPSMKLAYPNHKIKLVRKNGQTITEKNDTLRALENVNFEGEIRDFRDEFLLKNFNGKVNIKVYDKETTLQTLGNNANSKMNYRVFQDKIFETEASVENGKFKINFTVPKDIQYKYGSGRIEMYAENAEKTMDALAVHNKIIIGGSQNIPEKDQNPPQILAYLDHEDFVNGSKTGPNPILIATIADDKGLNINTAATGHEITAKLDGKTIFILNENIRPILDKPNHYHISYPLINLAPGNHSLEVTAWDIYNNSFSKTLEFTVVLNDLEQLTKVFNFPNPITDHTQIHFEHNFIGENLKNEVSIFNINGQLIKQFSQNIFEAESPILIKIPFNLGSDTKLQKGIYPYKVEATTEKTNKTAFGTGKLIVID